MWRIVMGVFLGLALAAGAFPYAPSSFTQSNATFSAGYQDFTWTWSEVAQNDLRAVFTPITNASGCSVVFRMTATPTGPAFFSSEAGSVTSGASGLVWSMTMTNLLPPRDYLAEFLLVSNSVAVRTLAKGRVLNQRSLYAGTNSAIYAILAAMPGYVVTNRQRDVDLGGTFTGVFRGIIYGTVTDLVAGVSKIDASSDITPSGDGTGNLTLSLTPGRTNQIAKGEAAFAWGDHAGLYDLLGSANAVSNALAAGAAAGATAVQPAALAGYVATSNPAFLAAITGAVYGAQNGPSVSGRVLTIGTNLFGGGTGGGDVASVNGQTGAVVLTAGDVGAVATDDATYTATVALAAGAVQATDATYTDTVAKASSALQDASTWSQYAAGQMVDFGGNDQTNIGTLYYQFGRLQSDGYWIDTNNTFAARIFDRKLYDFMGNEIFNWNGISARFPSPIN